MQCVTVPGYSKGFGYQTGQSFSGEFDHAWNAVYREGRWHLVDSTWGSGLVATTTSKFTFLSVRSSVLSVSFLSVCGVQTRLKKGGMWGKGRAKC